MVAKSVKPYGEYRAIPSKASTKSFKSTLAPVFRIISSRPVQHKGTENGTTPTNKSGLTSSAGGKQYRSRLRKRNIIRVTVAFMVDIAISSRPSRKGRGSQQRKRKIRRARRTEILLSPQMQSLKLIPLFVKQGV